MADARVSIRVDPFLFNEQNSPTGEPGWVLSNLRPITLLSVSGTETRNEQLTAKTDEGRIIEYAGSICFTMYFRDIEPTALKKIKIYRSVLGDKLEVIREIDVSKVVCFIPRQPYFIVKTGLLLSSYFLHNFDKEKPPIEISFCGENPDKCQKVIWRDTVVLIAKSHKLRFYSCWLRYDLPLIIVTDPELDETCKAYTNDELEFVYITNSHGVLYAVNMPMNRVDIVDLPRPVGDIRHAWRGGNLIVASDAGLEIVELEARFTRSIADWSKFYDDAHSRWLEAEADLEKEKTLRVANEKKHAELVRKLKEEHIRAVERQKQEFEKTLLQQRTEIAATKKISMFKNVSDWSKLHTATQISHQHAVSSIDISNQDVIKQKDVVIHQAKADLETEKFLRAANEKKHVALVRNLKEEHKLAMERQKQEFEKAFKHKHPEIAAAKQANRALKENNRELNRRLGELQQELQAQNHAVNTLQRSIQSKIDDRDKHIVLMKGQLNEATRNSDALRANNHALTQKLAEIQQEQVTYLETHEETVSQLSEKSQCIENLIKHIDIRDLKIFELEGKLLEIENKSSNIDWEKKYRRLLLLFARPGMDFQIKEEYRQNFEDDLTRNQINSEGIDLAAAQEKVYHHDGRLMHSEMAQSSLLYEKPSSSKDTREDRENGRRGWERVEVPALFYGKIGRKAKDGKNSKASKQMS